MKSKTVMMWISFVTVLMDLFRFCRRIHAHGWSMWPIAALVLLIAVAYLGWALYKKTGEAASRSIMVNLLLLLAMQISFLGLFTR